jgi:hypothetical protein
MRLEGFYRVFLQYFETNFLFENSPQYEEV